jgi:nucleoside-diphosphate-sugar epimerase
MRIVVTGALGHIGSRFIHSLKSNEYDRVVLLDNLSTQRYCSLFNLPNGIRFEFYEADILTADLERFFEGVDVVIHLAAITNAAGSFEIQDEVERINFQGTKRVARACSVCGCKLFFPSTTSVYGTQETVVDEECSREELKPQSPYAESKLRAERCLQRLGNVARLKFVICRFGTIFGTSIGMRFHTAVNKFVWQACLGQPLTVWRTAMNQKRAYLDLNDSVKAILHIINKNIFDNQIYNIVTTNSTVAEIISIIKDFIPNTKVGYVDSQIMNQLTYTVLNNKFKSTGFKFSGNLKKGIFDTIKILEGVMKKSNRILINGR